MWFSHMPLAETTKLNGLKPKKKRNESQTEMRNEKVIVREVHGVRAEQLDLASPVCDICTLWGTAELALLWLSSLAQTPARF